MDVTGLTSNEDSSGWRKVKCGPAFGDLRSADIVCNILLSARSGATISHRTVGGLILIRPHSRRKPGGSRDPRFNNLAIGLVGPAFAGAALEVLRASHRLQYLILGDVGRHDLVPVGVLRQDLLAGADMVVAGAGTGRAAALLGGHHGMA